MLRAPPRPKIQIGFKSFESKVLSQHSRIEKVLPSQTNEGIQLFFLSENHSRPGHTDTQRKWKISAKIKEKQREEIKEKEKVLEWPMIVH